MLKPSASIPLRCILFENKTRNINSSSNIYYILYDNLMIEIAISFRFSFSFDIVFYVF